MKKFRINKKLPNAAMPSIGYINLTLVKKIICSSANSLLPEIVKKSIKKALPNKNKKISNIDTLIKLFVEEYSSSNILTRYLIFY